MFCISAAGGVRPVCGLPIEVIRWRFYKGFDQDRRGKRGKERGKERVWEEANDTDSMCLRVHVSLRVCGRACAFTFS